MSMQDTTVLTFVEDARHGWLQVPRSHLNGLGIAEEITPYSYQNRNTIYLEEDLDMGTYLNARRAQGWSDVEMVREYHESWIGRDRYPSYRSNGR